MTELQGHYSTTLLLVLFVILRLISPTVVGVVEPVVVALLFITFYRGYMSILEVFV